MSGYSRMMQTLREQYLLRATPITFTRRDGEKKTTLTLDEVKSLALIGAVTARHWQTREARKGTVATVQQMRKQGLQPDFISAVLRLTAGAKVQAPKEPTLGNH